MQFYVAKWGNSLALRLPNHLVRAANLTEGTPVEFSTRDGTVVITPVRKKYKLDELLAQMTEDQRHPETDWGDPKGDEVW
ncbi:AbrB/MazE/SpoVT family DNA-binding domain-containing protein [Croceibacterium sp. LX-88]|uniref:AbrB/MazE/SpoVT family DNA-binding domain-containing protein n=1 Tax=Croceibacterium selenioxidans TaxID=2838833 RepID=A0ABS5W688_9SPHN|nr:AbrB/MazE/SpoVT family DNA-binding domain-containing protein [Croceibacterium selenioxidans]MBT2134857.1 AbrB/MazE/SpoVT family DNA-binding domain-containing protein [Croceibacterium selenioxidans]